MPVRVNARRLRDSAASSRGKDGDGKESASNRSKAGPWANVSCSHIMEFVIQGIKNPKT